MQVALLLMVKALVWYVTSTLHDRSSVVDMLRSAWIARLEAINYTILCIVSSRFLAR